MSDRCLQAIVTQARSLELLDVSCVASLTEAGFMALLSATRLHTLTARCTKITDVVVANLLLVLEGLLNIDLSHCQNVTNEALTMLLRMVNGACVTASQNRSLCPLRPTTMATSFTTYTMSYHCLIICCFKQHISQVVYALSSARTLSPARWRTSCLLQWLQRVS